MRWLAVMVLVAVPASASADALPAGPFTENECRDCHIREGEEIVADWRAGAHGTAVPAVGCLACHDDRHPAAPRARRAKPCIACHGGRHGDVARSYLTSKHGVITTLETDRWDWSQPLAHGLYRAPTCAYCHNHAGGHGTAAGEDACFDCHSPRFVTTHFESGRRTLDIGGLKVREAEAAVAEATNAIGPEDAGRLSDKLGQMRERSLTGLRLGIAHQAPDYVWWLGQAALDGDLVRIKAAISALRRAATVGRSKRAETGAVRPAGRATGPDD